MTYKYKTLEDIRQLQKYKELSQVMGRLGIEPMSVLLNELYQLFDWYIDQCAQCEECIDMINKEIDKFCDVKDIALGDKNVFIMEE